MCASSILCSRWPSTFPQLRYVFFGTLTRRCFLDNGDIDWSLLHDVVAAFSQADPHKDNLYCVMESYNLSQHLEAIHSTSQGMDGPIGLAAGPLFFGVCRLCLAKPLASSTTQHSRILMMKRSLRTDSNKLHALAAPDLETSTLRGIEGFSLGYQVNFNAGSPCSPSPTIVHSDVYVLLLFFTHWIWCTGGLASVVNHFAPGFDQVPDPFPALVLLQTR